MMATSGNGRETALGVGAILLDLHIFGRDIKTQKSRGVPQVAKSVYSTKLKKKSTHNYRLLRLETFVDFVRLLWIFILDWTQKH